MKLVSKRGIILLDGLLITKNIPIHLFCSYGKIDFCFKFRAVYIVQMSARLVPLRP